MYCQKLLRSKTLLTSFLFFLTLSFIVPSVHAESSMAASKRQLKKWKPYYKALLLADANTGRIIYADNEWNRIYPASVVKMMVGLLTMEALQEGKIKLTDKVKVSRWASKIGGRQVYLKEGEVFELEELIKAMAISSANDATVAIAEHISGSQRNFVRRMNERARQLKLTQTHFKTPHGLPPGRKQEYDVSTTHDLFVLAEELLKHPGYLKWSSTQLDSFRNGTYQLLNTNRPLMRRYRGMDGLKTGYHRKAGFNLVATAKREDTRLISIVMGAPNTRWRSKITEVLMDMGFDNHEKKKLGGKGDLLERTLPVANGTDQELKLQLGDDVYALLSDEEYKRIGIRYQLPPEVVAPVAIGSTIGRVEFWLDEKMLKSVSIQAQHGIEEPSLLESLTNSLKLWTGR